MTPSADYLNALRRQFDIFDIPLALRPEIRGMNAPYDYVRPGLATFDDEDKVWPRSSSGEGQPHLSALTAAVGLGRG